MNAKFQRPLASEPITGQTSEPHAAEFIRTAAPAKGEWRWMDLAFSLGLAGLLAWSWLWPQGRAVWNQVDATLFRFLNGALAFEWWRKGWACLNHRYCDWAGLVVYTGLLVYAWKLGRRSLRSCAISVALIAIMVLLLQGSTHVARKLGKGSLNRPSPTLANPDAWRLRELVPEVRAKDASSWSFPSDHGLVALSMLLYLGYRGPQRTVRIGVLLTAVFLIPRLVAGAHWFTDVAVGSAVLALVGTSLLMATPLHDWALNRIARGRFALRSKSNRPPTAKAAAAAPPAVARPAKRRVETAHLSAPAGS